METHITGPPAPLRPHIRQRRLHMGRVHASVERHEAMKAQRLGDEELAFANIQLNADRQRRGDEALDHLANLVAAFLCPKYQSEPVSEFPERANDQPLKEHEHE